MSWKKLIAMLKQAYTVVREWYSISNAVVKKKKIPFEISGSFLSCSVVIESNGFYFFCFGGKKKYYSWCVLTMVHSSKMI